MVEQRPALWHYHPSVWTFIDALRQDSAVAETEVVRSQRGQLPKKRVKRTIELQERLLKICCDCATGKMSVAEALSATAVQVNRRTLHA